jgi:hypothetical protein
MANTSFQTLVDRVLQKHGQAPTPADAGVSFDANALEKIQLQTKLFFAQCHSDIVNRVRARFLRRTFTITTAAWNGPPQTGSNNKYLVDVTTTPERIQKKTMFDTTNQVGPLDYWPFQQFECANPGGEIVASRPAGWYLQEPDGTGNDYICFTAPPDGVYVIKYQAYLKPQPLVNHGDLVMIPFDYEHVLEDAAGTYCEYMLAEGKSPDFEKYVETAIARMKRLTLGPVEEIPQIDLDIDVQAYRTFDRSFDNWTIY